MMTFRHLRRLPFIVLPLLAPVLGQAEPYELSKQTYERLGVLPAYDHDGTLPAGESRAYEIEWIDRERARRNYYITTFEEQLPLVVATAHTPDGKQQLREDMASRRETHERWDESALKRRDTIASASAYRDPGQPRLEGLSWEELKRELAPDSVPSFAQTRGGSSATP
jgi:hypothetical protein